MSELVRFDPWLNEGSSVAAVVAREQLQSVDGPDGVIFPPTFAAESDGQKGDYNINYFGDEFDATITYQTPGEQQFRTELKSRRPTSVCLVNTVGAEANKIEPLFKAEQYAKLVPQAVIRAGEVEVNLLDVGHRAGDAIVRFSEYGQVAFEAFTDLLNRGCAEKLARLAPTSLVFGVWDSRATQAKVPRIFRSVVRAYDIRRLKRSAQYNPPVEYKDRGLVDAGLDKGKGDENPLSREGFKHNPAVNTPGGIVVDGELRREIAINLAALRALRVCKAGTREIDVDGTRKLRRYLLGLALVAATARNPERFNLREGCLLRVKPGTKTEWKAIPFDGDDAPLPELDIGLALNFAHLAAAEFKVTNPDPATFDEKVASKWLALKKDDQDKLRRKEPRVQKPGRGKSSKEGD